MPDPRRIDLKINGFSELLYRTMTTATTEQKKGVEEGLRRHLKDNRTAHRFCNNYPMGKQMIMYTQLGNTLALMAAPNIELIDETLQALIGQYRVAGKRLNVVEAMSRNSVFFASDREMMILAQIGAQNCQTGIYGVSQFTQDLMKTRKDFNRIESCPAMMDRGEKAIEDFNRLALATFNSQEYIASVLSLTDIQLRLLQALFDKKNSAVEIKTIIEMVNMGGNPSVVKKSLKELVDMNMVQDDKSGKEKRAYGKEVNFMITSPGIKKVVEYLKFIHPSLLSNK